MDESWTVVCRFSRIQFAYYQDTISPWENADRHSGRSAQAEERSVNAQQSAEPETSCFDIVAGLDSRLSMVDCRWSMTEAVCGMKVKISQNTHSCSIRELVHHRKNPSFWLKECVICGERKVSFDINAQLEICLAKEALEIFDVLGNVQDKVGLIIESRWGAARTVFWEVVSWGRLHKCTAKCGRK